MWYMHIQICRIWLEAILQAALILCLSMMVLVNTLEYKVNIVYIIFRSYLHFKLDYHVGQVRAIFRIPSWLVDFVFGPEVHTAASDYLVYVELFKPCEQDDTNTHGLFTVRRAYWDGMRAATIVPLFNIRRSVHLIPKFGSEPIDRAIKAEDVLEKYDVFYVNSFSDRHAYHTIIWCTLSSMLYLYSV